MCTLAISLRAQEPVFATIRGRKIHYVQTPGASPTIVFVPGMGEDVQTWAPVQKELAPWMTLSYDRPGLGLSEPTPATRDGETLARELHELLAALKVPPPYVVVGHSLGGAVVQVFANLYAHEMKALVLLDPEDGRLVEQIRKQLSKEKWDQREAAIAQYVKLAPEQQREMDASGATGEEVAKIRKLPDIPIRSVHRYSAQPRIPGQCRRTKNQIRIAQATHGRESQD
jgi:pimeloyl-ACP methyl ester carboxylesterase